LEDVLEVSFSLDLLLKGLLELLVLDRLSNVLEELDDLPEIDMLTHFLHELLDPDDQEEAEVVLVFLLQILHFLEDLLLYPIEAIDTEEPELLRLVLRQPDPILLPNVDDLRQQEVKLLYVLTPNALISKLYVRIHI